MERLPPIRSAVGLEEKERLFLGKLEQCRFRYVSDHSDQKTDTLVELIIAVRTEPEVLTSAVCGALCDMVAQNAFRDTGAPRTPNAPEFDPEEDDPTLVPEWEQHLRLVYELFDKFLESSAAKQPEIPRLYVTKRFVNNVLALFYNEDPRERTVLKGILHKIYGTFVCLRKGIRTTMEHIFSRAIYDERGRCNGIPDLLQILGSIINGFALPLKEEHVNFLKKVLLPLHSVREFNQCFEELRYCTIQYVEKDKNLAWPVLKGLLKYWSKTNSMKQVLFLSEVEEVLNIISTPQFELARDAVFKQISKCMASQHFQVAEGALSMLNRGIVENLVRTHKDTILPIIIPVLNRCITSKKPYWNPTILGIARCLRKKLRELSPDLFQQLVLKRKRAESNDMSTTREHKWQRLMAMAQHNNPEAEAEAEANLPPPQRLMQRNGSMASIGGLEDGDAMVDLDASFQGSPLPQKALLVRRKSLLPRDMQVQEKIANFHNQQGGGSSLGSTSFLAVPAVATDGGSGSGGGSGGGGANGDGDEATGMEMDPDGAQ